MRVVAGTAKGRELRAPRNSKTRPTSDKVRDAIFNVLGDRVAGAKVLDLYAGSGALAIEALSRGAESAEMVESDHEASSVIRRNLELTGFESRATLWKMPVERALDKIGTRFDIVVADPPYAMEGVDRLLESLGTGELLTDDVVVVLEHGKRLDPPGSCGRLVRFQQKRYGDTCVSFYDLGGE